MQSELKPLSSYSTRMEAEEIKKLLENNGIECLLQFDEIGGVLESVGVHNGPTTIYVVPGDLKRARAIAGTDKRE